MRFIDLEKIKPAIRDKIEALDEARAAVLAEPDPGRRAALIDRYRPRWTALREAFAAYSHDKCWYVECKNFGTDDDIDHYRPKSGVREEPGHPGYYWLAFEWTNLRLSCHRANRPRTNPETGETGGKAEHFPLIDPRTRARGPDDDLSLEVPALLDPTKPPDVALLSFKPNGEVDLSPQFKGEPLLEAKFEASRLLLHLNWPKFRDARVMLYNQIERIVDRGDREAPQNYSGLQTAGEAFMDACRDLCTTMGEREESSAAARVYVESFKHVWWVRDIVLRVPA
jgi:5-methylcytosine-specific restriction endonuclease McrA